MNKKEKHNLKRKKLKKIRAKQLQNLEQNAQRVKIFGINVIKQK